MSRTPEEKAERKQVRKQRRKRTWAAVQRAVNSLVRVAEDLFPEDGKGSARAKWVAEQAAARIRTPHGDELESNVIGFLIELAVDSL